MRHGFLIVLVVLALGGVYLLGNGITGLVILQSCCFPPNCPQEDICAAAKPNVEQPSLITGPLAVGILLLGVVVLLYALSRSHERNKRL